VAVNKLEKGNLLREIGEVSCGLLAVVFSVPTTFTSPWVRLHFAPQRLQQVDDSLFTSFFEC
jgi:hypothetical protein